MASMERSRSGHAVVGPQGFTSPLCRMDFREGGTTLVCMRSDQGWEVYNTWTYSSIEPMERIEFVQRFADSDGNPVAPADLGMPPAIPEQVRHVLVSRRSTAPRRN